MSPVFDTITIILKGAFNCPYTLCIWESTQRENCQKSSHTPQTFSLQAYVTVDIVGPLQLENYEAYDPIAPSSKKKNSTQQTSHLDLAHSFYTVFPGSSPQIVFL